MQTPSVPDVSAVSLGDGTTESGTAPAAPAAADASETAATPPTAAEAPAAAPAAEQEEDTIVQFIVVRRDLLKTLEWPVGSVIAQACHASTAVMFEHRNDESVLAYLSNLGSMHKIVKECKGEPQLLTLADKLNA